MSLARNETTVPIPEWLQGYIGETIIGEKGSVLKSLYMEEPDTFGTRHPKPNLKGINVFVKGNKGNQNLIISTFQNDRHSGKKVAEVTKEFNLLLTSLAHQWGQTQGYYDNTDKFFPNYKPASHESKAKKPDWHLDLLKKGQIYLHTRDESPFFISQDTKKKRTRAKQTGPNDGWQVPAILTKDGTLPMGWGFKHFDYIHQKSVNEYGSVDSSHIKSDRLDKLNGSNVFIPSKNKKRVSPWCNYEGSSDVISSLTNSFDEVVLNNPYSLKENDHAKYNLRLAKGKVYSGPVQIVSFGTKQEYVTVDLNWFMADTVGYKPKLLTWKTSHLIPYKITEAEWKNIDTIRSKVEHVPEVESNNTWYTDTSKTIEVHTHDEVSDGLEEAWDFYRRMVQAIEVGNWDLFLKNVTQLDIHGVDFGVFPTQKPLLFVAVQHGMIEIIRHLVENLNVPLNHIGKHGNTAIHLALWHGNRDVANMLYEYGACADIVNEFGERPDDLNKE